MIGTYVPRRSVIHRIPPGAKLIAVASGITALAFVPRWQLLVAALILILALFPVAQLGPRYAWQAMRPALVLSVVLTAFHWLTDGLGAAVSPVGQLIIGIVAANLLVFTTRVTDLVNVIGRVAGPRVELMLALTIRCIPTVALVVRSTREACWARGQRVSIIRVLPTVLVRLIRDADLVGEALVARGL
ncbi:energy-coupling factor transporter transmembrane protein EcfT [Tsukamurella sp. 8F]|uniref:energy-coupling factor transporter transmembrane component T family protein n=1 Tax=unclassified Tsukamurella TaxID=2633480 RepID=UPI0023BA2562|nr:MULTISPECIES: energy-coupling factor transporter transmembrane protein EcfT [unclassified Tsukamurella]MDF0531788.1 energy-coupling factor transporter transmembrane protein EcfT [Tsukamurella sp. 8J]MDF0589030.1 energy-coupling factor transporter transmembrane protein EcfT [Tsukamurella sp. 8F]